MKFRKKGASLIGLVVAGAIGAAALAAPAQADEGFIVCPDGRSGVATTVTSCAFARNVRSAYLNQDGPIVVAYSPVTDVAYNMQCQGGFTAYLVGGAIVDSVRCVGGNNAVVVLF
jgi:hypothetical protein